MYHAKDQRQLEREAQERAAQKAKKDAQVPVSDAEFRNALEENGCASCYDSLANFCTMVSYVITCCGCCTSYDEWEGCCPED